MYFRKCYVKAMREEQYSAFASNVKVIMKLVNLEANYVIFDANDASTSPLINEVILKFLF